MSEALQGLIARLSPEKRALLADMLHPEPEPIAVVGIGCRFPGGVDSPATFWELLKNGRDGRVEVPAERWDMDSFYDPDPNASGKSYVRVGGFLPNLSRFDADFFGISPREAVRMDPQQRLLLETTWEALEDAGLTGEAADQATGVFVGMTNNQHMLRQVMADPEFFRDPFAGIGSDCSAAAGRLAYTFNFQGPTVSLDTACSSSLVALHLACQSLRNKECDRAVVGGVYAIMMPQTFIIGCRMGMLSPDGRCKTFDAAADGYGLGEGCGIVVLKRLREALADGDHVRAIIRGSAVNEDGRSNGLTAPNGLAQQAVIRRALASANIEPPLVSYVEAHGTGTPLGDPIEVESVQAVLGNGRSPDQPLFIGSVKTNLGHLYTAAGIAGLIKTVLALQHQTIPQHLHFDRPNVTVAWDEQIQVPTQPRPWQPVDGRRIAGVSSFGWSGTNAHVIVEEAPVQEPGKAKRPCFLLPLSAPTPEALEATTTTLHRHLQDNPTISLADVAYTLQTGRRHFAHRRVFACRNRTETLRTLAGAPTARRFDNVRSTQTPRVVFLFSGVGDHYPNMGREIYEQELVFREVVDHCCDFLRPLLGLDLRQMLYPAYTNGTSNGAVNGTANGHTTSVDLRQMVSRKNGSSTGQVNGETEAGLARTEYAQPAVFVIDYALAHLLQTWGIRPDALLGHSLGEYVAACVAGVLSLEDALTLVARRSQLIQSLPPGRMLAVALPVEQIRPFLNESVSLAVHNGEAMCTLAGPPEEIDRLAAKLSQREIACRLLETPRAFHSPMMAAAGDALTELVQTISLNPPQIPYLSNVTGSWITDEQATDPTYWAQHLCQTVRFFDGASQLLEGQEQILVEVGPGQSLGSFVRQHPSCTPAQMGRIAATLPALFEKRSSLASLLETVGKLWASGARPHWQALYAEDESRQRVPLPTHPFAGERFWVGPEMRQFADEQATTVPTTAAPTVKTAASLSRLPLDDWFYLPGWQQAAPHEPRLPEQVDGWLIFADESGLGAQVVTWLRQQGQPVLTIRPGSAWQQRGENDYEIRPSVRADYDTLLQVVEQRGWRRVENVHLWTVTAESPTVHGGDFLETMLNRGFYSLIALAQALHERNADAWGLSVVTSDVHSVTGAEMICPEKAPVIGPCRAIPLEYEQITCRLVDVSLPSSGRWQGTALLTNLLGELTAEVTDPIIALRHHQRWQQTFSPLTLPPATADKPELLRQSGAYLITGGLGGLGLAVAHYLAQTAQANVALLSRTPLPPRRQWPELLAAADETSDVGRKIRQIQQLEAMGVGVLPLAADVTDASQMETAVHQIQERFGALHGVIHAAGVPGKGLIQLKTQETAAQVLAPKVRGTLVLEKVLKQADVRLDFLLLFSSIASFMPGGPGQVDYCAANAFLDAYAQSCVGQERVTAVVNWGEWQWNSWEAALADFSDEVQDFFRQNRAEFGITFAEGRDALARILTRPLSQTIVSTQNFPQLVESARQLTVSSLLAPGRQESATCHPRPVLSNTYVAPRNDRERTIASAWEEALGVSGIGIDDNFFELGGNSLIGLGLVKQLQQILHLPQIPDRILYEAPSIRTLAQALGEEQQQSKALVDEQHARGQKRYQRYMERRRQKLRDG